MVIHAAKQHGSFIIYIAIYMQITYIYISLYTHIVYYTVAIICIVYAYIIYIYYMILCKHIHHPSLLNPPTNKRTAWLVLAGSLAWTPPMIASRGPPRRGDIEVIGGIAWNILHTGIQKTFNILPIYTYIDYCPDLWSIHVILWSYVWCDHMCVIIITWIIL
jgi:hypothetical protein